MQMTFDAALAAVDAMSPQEQMRALAQFGQTSAGFDDVREAFIDAVEVADAPAPPRPWVTNWAGVIGLALAALSTGALLAWLYTLIRLMELGL